MTRWSVKARSNPLLLIVTPLLVFDEVHLGGVGVHGLQVHLPTPEHIDGIDYKGDRSPQGTYICMLKSKNTTKNCQHFMVYIVSHVKIANYVGVKQSYNNFFCLHHP